MSVSYFPNDLERIFKQAHRLFFLGAEDGMFITSKEGIFLEVNLSLAKLFGYSREELLGRNVQEVYAFPMARRRFQAEMEAKGRVEKYPVRLARKDGTHFQALLNAFRWSQEDGGSGGYLGRIRHKEEVTFDVYLEPTKNFHPLQHAIDIAGDGLWEWQLIEKRIVYSARWKELLGYQENEIDNKIEEWFTRVHADDFKKLRHAISEVLRGSEPQLQMLLRMRHRDGQDRKLLVRGKAVFNQMGKPIILAGSFSNLTHFVQAIEKLKQTEISTREAAEKIDSENKLLGKYFSVDQLETLHRLEENDNEAEVGTMTVLATEITGIASLLEKLGPEKFASLANEILTDLMDMIYGKGGSVMVIEGGALIAVFGGPEWDTRSAVDAIECAGQFQAYLSTYNDVRPDEVTDPIRFSTALASGSIFLGNLGSVRRREFTIIGEAVIAAKKLREVASKLNGKFLLDSKTHSALVQAPRGLLFKKNPELKLDVTFKTGEIFEGSLIPVTD